MKVDEKMVAEVKQLARECMAPLEEMHGRDKATNTVVAAELIVRAIRMLPTGSRRELVDACLQQASDRDELILTHLGGLSND